MSHTNNYAKYDPYVAEIAAKVDDILSQYDNVLGDVQIPFNVGQAMVKAHERGQRSKFENELFQYQTFLTEAAPGYKAWRWQKNYETIRKELIDWGKEEGTWFGFMKYMKQFLNVMAMDGKNNGNLSIVFYDDDFSR